MTNGGAGSDRLTKNQRREAAREKARELREQQRKKERRSRWLIQGGIIVASLAIIAVVALVITNSVRPAGPGPQNMASDGIKITQGLQAVETPGLEPGATPRASEPNPDGVIDVRVYLDYLCPFCRQFEEANAEQLQTLLDEGAITYEIHPISFLDRASQGTRYSTRAANAFACVAENSPASAFAVNAALFAAQPEEQTPGLTDEELIEVIEGAGVENADDIEQCITDGQFIDWVEEATVRAQNGPLPGTEVESVEGTPTVLVNGEQYAGSPGDAQAFAQFLSQAAGEDFNESSTPTPTPTPTP